MAFNLSPSQQFDPLSNGVTGGVSDIFDRSLGPALRPGAPNPYEARSYNRINMLAEYEKAAPVIRNTIEDYTLTSEYDWLSRYILPIYYTDEIEFAWTAWETTNVYMGPTPHLSNSNVIAMKRKIRKGSLIRRGIAYEFEDDYIRTAGGRASVYAAIGCISRSLREVINVEGLRALRSCHIHDVEFAREYNLYTIDDLDAHLDRFTERFMIVQKTEFGVEKLNELVDADQERIQGKANAWIFGREIAAYCTVVDPNKTLFYLGGQEAVDRVNGRQVGQAAAANTMGNIRSVAPTFSVKNTPVFIAKSYYVDGIQQADLLTRTVEIGVYNMMVDRTQDYTEYRPACRNLKIYNGDRDDWHIETFANALSNLPIWNDAGNLLDPFTGNNRMNKLVAVDQTDFLSFPVGQTRKIIKYIGDMNKTWISEQDYLDAAQTMLNVLSYGDAAEARKLLIDTDSAIDAVIDANSAAIFNKLNGMFGNDSLFTTSLDNFRALYNGNATRATRLVPTDSEVGDANVEAKKQQFITDIIGFPVPDKYKPQVVRIANEGGVPWKERANKVKTIILDILRSDANAIPQLPDTQAVDVWFDKRVASFTKEMEKHQSVRPVGAAVHGGGALAMLQAIVNTTLNPGSRGAPMREVPNADANIRNLAVTMERIDATSASKLHKILAKVYAATEFKRDRLIQLHAAGVVVKLNIMLARPHGAVKSRYGMKVATGGIVGFTGMGHSSLDIGHDAGKKAGFMHFTTMIGPLVTDPRHVAVVPDIYVTKYVGGLGVEYWTPEKYKAEKQRRTASIIAIPLPPQVKKMDKRIDLRGRWYTMQKLGFITDDRFNRDMFPGAARINALFGLDVAGTNAQSRNNETNYWLSQGMEWYMNPKTGAWDDFTVEQSPFGSKVYPGCGAARNGNLKFLDTPKYLQGY